MGASCSIFSQLLQLFPRSEFNALVARTGAEHRAKGLSSWSQFVAMMFCQLGRAHSLREIEGGLRSCEGKLDHLGIEAPARSSLSYANQHRPAALFEQVFYALYEKIAAQAGVVRRKFRFNNKLLSVDSTSIDLSLSIYDWAHYQRTKGAIKLHMALDHDGYLPCFCMITDGKVADIRVARAVEFAPGTIVVHDRGYTDYDLFQRWCDERVYFVTRMKEQAAYEVLRQRTIIAPEGGVVVADQVIRLSSEAAQRQCWASLRRVEVIRPDNGEVMALLTNNMTLSARTIGQIYQERWQIELFFKALKQSAKIKTFVGTTPNAVRTQIWTALICMLLLKWLQMRSQYGWSLSNLVALLRMNLFAHKDLHRWLAQPYARPPDPAADGQPELAWA
ncbi:MAG: IS4 family transposase [Pseudomonadota bacterium]